MNDGSASSAALSRRRFLQGAALATVASAVGLSGLAAARVVGSGAPASAADRLRALVGSSPGTARIGRAAMQGRDVESDATGLLDGLRNAIPALGGLLLNGTDDQLCAALDAARRADFRPDGIDTIRVDGWVVSRTEARLCALAALG